MNTLIRTLLLVASIASAPAWAQVQIENAWARATVQGQKATGAFMKITATQATQLVAVASPVAGIAEIHEMKMDGGVMKMRAMPALELPARQPVELKPGGYHLMLMDLKAPLPKDSKVTLTLTFRDARGVESRQQIALPVVSSMPHTGNMGGHGHPHGEHRH